MATIRDICLDNLNRQDCFQGFYNNNDRDFIRRLELEALAEIKDNAKPAASYEIYKIYKLDGYELTLPSGQSFTSSLFKHLFKGSEELAVIIYTLGPQIEERIEKYFCDGRSAYAVMLDRACIGAIRFTGRFIRNTISEYAQSNGYKMTPSLSPGHGDFNIKAQKTVFELIEAHALNIILNESYVMVPLKTVTALVGMGEHVRSEGSQCDYCKRKETCSSSSLFVGLR